MITQTLLVNHVLKQFFRWLEIIPSPIEHLFTNRLLLFIMQSIEIRMSQTLLDCIAFIWIESQHFRKQIRSCWLYIWE